MRRAWLLAGCWLLTTASPVLGSDRTGVLVIAHGGGNQWDGAVRKAVRQAKLDAPTEVAFGMAMHRHELRTLQQAVNRLERKGVSRIVVVPLLVSSRSEVFRQQEYVFGLRPTPEWPEAGEPLDLEVPVVMAQTLEGSLALEEVLIERALAMSREPAKETVVLVAHGPNEEADNQRWLAELARLAQRIKQEGRFQDAVGVTIRDDAPNPVRNLAVDQFRSAVQTASQRGRALVVPVLIAQGGVERKIPGMLAGLSYAYRGETLLPHPKLSQWIAEQAAQASPTDAQNHSVNFEAVIK